MSLYYKSPPMTQQGSNPVELFKPSPFVWSPCKFFVQQYIKLNLSIIACSYHMKTFFPFAFCCRTLWFSEILNTWNSAQGKRFVFWTFSDLCVSLRYFSTVFCYNTCIFWNAYGLWCLINWNFFFLMGEVDLVEFLWQHLSVTWGKQESWLSGSHPLHIHVGKNKKWSVSLAQE